MVNQRHSNNGSGANVSQGGIVRCAKWRVEGPGIVAVDLKSAGVNEGSPRRRRMSLGVQFGIGLRFERLKRYHCGEPKLARLSSSRRHLLRPLCATTGLILWGTGKLLVKPGRSSMGHSRHSVFTKSSFFDKAIRPYLE